MNANHQFIRRRGKRGTLYFRRRYPTDLVDQIGSAVYDKSLGTVDMAEADAAAARCALEYVQTVERARADKRSAMSRTEAVRLLEKVGIKSDFVDTKVSAWMRAEVFGDEGDFGPEIRKFDTAAQARASISTFALDHVPEAFREAFQDAAMSEYLHAIPTLIVETKQRGRPFKSVPSSKDRKEKSVTLKTVFSEWEKRSGHPETRLTEGRNAVRDFLSVNGLDDIPVDEISYEQVMEYFDLLLRKPNKSGVPLGWYDLPLVELMEKWERKNDGAEYETIALATVAKLGSALSAMVNDQKKRGRVKNNPFSGNVPRPNRQEKRRARRDSFTEDQARAVFQSPIWTGQHERIRARAGNHIYRDAYFWVLPVLAWTGARLSEIAALHVDNICEEHGIPYIDLHEIDPLQSLKTEASERRIPLHSELLNAGFLDHVKKQTGAWVFPEIMGSEDPANAIKSMSRRYNRDIVHGYCELPKKVTVHSFRHTFKSALRRLGYADGSEIWYPLLGHEDGRAGAGYGDHPIGPLNDVVQRVEIPGASLKHLKK